MFLSCNNNIFVILFGYFFITLTEFCINRLFTLKSSEGSSFFYKVLNKIIEVNKENDPIKVIEAKVVKFYLQYCFDNQCEKDSLSYNSLLNEYQELSTELKESSMNWKILSTIYVTDYLKSWADKSKEAGKLVFLMTNKQKCQSLKMTLLLKL